MRLKQLTWSIPIVVGIVIAMGGIAQGTDDQPVIAGQINDATRTTTLQVDAENGFSVQMTSGDGVGISSGTTGDGQAIRGSVEGGAGGCAICGVASADNTAILAVGAAGFDGPIFARQAGVVVVSAGQTKAVTKADQQLPEAALVLATPQTHGSSVASARAIPKTSKIIIRLTGPAATDVTVAWFVFAA